MFFGVFMPFVAYCESLLQNSSFPATFEDLSFSAKQDFKTDDYETIKDLSPYDQMVIVYVDEQAQEEISAIEKEEETKEEAPINTTHANTQLVNINLNNTQPYSAYCASRTPNITPGQKYPIGKPVYESDYVMCSKYGYRKIKGRDDYHYGIDIGCKEKYYDRPVFSVADGVVEKISLNTKDKAHGNLIKLRHADGFKTMYMHLNKIMVTKGQKVYAGCQIGTIGDTGGAKAAPETLHTDYPQMGKHMAHLHYEIHYSGKATSVSENGRTAEIHHGKSTSVNPEYFVNPK